MPSILSAPRRVQIGPVAAAVLTMFVLAADSLPGRARPGGDHEAPQPVPIEPGAVASRRARLAGVYATTVTRVIDGDTVEARVAVWLGQEIITKVRLRGVDAPEIHGACGAERDLAIAARDRLAQLVGGGAVLLGNVGGDKYFGRVVGDLFVGETNLAGVLLAEGLARPYQGGRRKGWCAFAGR